MFSTSIMEKRVFQKIIYADQILNKIESLEKNYREEVINEKEIKKIHKLILKNHEPLMMDILSEYAIPFSELISGVQCPTCERFPMKRISGTWKCSHCLTTSKTAHIKAIEEYLLLRNYITNQQYREFLQLDSTNIAYKILTDLNLLITGTKKNRKYYFAVK